MRTRGKLKCSILMLQVIFLATAANGATEMYIKFEGPSVAGSSQATGHEEEIEILSWNHGFSQPTSPTRSTAGSGTVEQANHQDFSFSKYIDSATADILKHVWAGKQFDKATVTCWRADGAPDYKPVKYLEVIMEHVIISNYSISGGPGDVPVENVSLAYGIISYNYLPQKKDTGGSGSNQPVKHNLETRKVE